jgi:glutamine synthetase
METAGTLVGCGTQNRYLPVRKIRDGHWELRFADATANFYLFLAVVIAAGLRGIQEHEKLH